MPPRDLNLYNRNDQRRYPVVRQILVLAVFLLTVVFAGLSPKLIAWIRSDKIEEITPKDITNEIASAPTTSKDEATPLSDVRVIAPSVHVYDVKKDQVLYSKDSDKILPLASITKLMTTLVAYELIDKDKTVTVSRAATLQESASGLTSGERLSMQNLVEYAMIASSNDGAYALANVAGAVINQDSPQTSFVSSMNIKAEELGLKTLEFKNPTGLDISITEAGAYGSAKEVSMLMKYILENHPEVLEPSTKPQAEIKNLDGSAHIAKNTNQILNNIPNILGSKTGYTDLAGGNLTIVFDAGYNRPVIVTVLGSTYDGRFRDVATLVDAVQQYLAQE